MNAAKPLLSLNLFGAWRWDKYTNKISSRQVVINAKFSISKQSTDMVESDGGQGQRRPPARWWCYSRDWGSGSYGCQGWECSGRWNEQHVEWILWLLAVCPRLCSFTFQNSTPYWLHWASSVSGFYRERKLFESRDIVLPLQENFVPVYFVPVY